jgi:hypothetical protein
MVCCEPGNCCGELAIEHVATLSAGFFLAAVPDDHEVDPGGSASYTIIVSNNAGPVPPVTFTLSGGPLNGSMGITPLGNNAFLLSVSTDPLDDESITSVIITATGPSGTQQIEVSLEIHQIPTIANPK